MCRVNFWNLDLVQTDSYVPMKTLIHKILVPALLAGAWCQWCLNELKQL